MVHGKGSRRKNRNTTTTSGVYNFVKRFPFYRLIPAVFSSGLKEGSFPDSSFLELGVKLLPDLTFITSAVTLSTFPRS